jgi:hypothetical protein
LNAGKNSTDEEEIQVLSLISNGVKSKRLVTSPRWLNDRLRGDNLALLVTSTGGTPAQ